MQSWVTWSSKETLESLRWLKAAWRLQKHQGFLWVSPSRPKTPRFKKTGWFYSNWYIPMTTPCHLFLFQTQLSFWKKNIFCSLRSLGQFTRKSFPCWRYDPIRSLNLGKWLWHFHLGHGIRLRLWKGTAEVPKHAKTIGVSRISPLQMTYFTW